MISGFLITGLLTREARNRRGISLGDFYARRARRILPAATVVLLGTAAAAFVVLGRVRTAEVLRDAVWAASFSASWEFAGDGTDHFAATPPASPVQHCWSLGVEEQLYLVWPAPLFLVLFAFAARRGPERGTTSPRRPGCAGPAWVRSSPCWRSGDPAGPAARPREGDGSVGRPGGHRPRLTQP